MVRPTLGNARDAAVQQRLDAFRDRFSGPYQVEGSQVTARPMFRMNTANSLNAKKMEAHAAVLSQICAKAGLAQASGPVRFGRCTPEQLVKVTQALIDAGKRTDIVPSHPAFPHSGVLLYEAWNMRHAATFPFSQSREVGVRYDILEILDGHLYAAEVNETRLHIVKLAMPSLQPVKMTDVPVAKVASSADRVQLTHSNKNLMALAHGVVVELTPDLEVVRKRELHSDEVAIGNDGELLSPLGLNGVGHRGDYVPDARASASCTPAWAGAYPLLACSVDMEGIRIARLAPR